MTQSNAPVRLQVADAKLQDIGEKRARVSRDVLASLGAAEGDPILLEANGTLLARVGAADPEDDGLGLVRLDGGQRHRLGVELGQQVDARVMEVPEAERLRIVLLGAAGEHALSAEHVHDSLDGHAVLVGDTVAITPDRRRFKAEVSVLGLSIAGIAGSSTDTDGILARVVATAPDGPVRIDEHTRIEMDHAAGEPDAGRDAAADGT